MRTGTIAVALAGVITVAGIACAFVRGEGDPGVTGPRAVAPSEMNRQLVEVDDLAAHPEAFPGEIAVRGVVAGMTKEEGGFGIVDARELKACGVLTCARNLLPVRFDGAIPRPKTVVEIRGQVVHGKQGLLLEAQGMEILP